MPRLSDRVRRRIDPLLDDAARRGIVTRRGEFLWRPGDDPDTWDRVRGVGDGEAREAASIPPEEIAAAARRVLDGAIALPAEALARETARQFGISRLGARVDAAMQAGIELLCNRGVAARDGDRVISRATTR